MLCLLVPGVGMGGVPVFIDGSNSRTLTVQYESMTLVSDNLGNSWWII